MKRELAKQSGLALNRAMKSANCRPPRSPAPTRRAQDRPGSITDSRTGADFFNHLIALRNDLQAGNTQAIASTDQANLAKDEDNITSQISANGLIQSQLNDASAVASTQSTALTKTSPRHRTRTWPRPYTPVHAANCLPGRP